MLEFDSVVKRFRGAATDALGGVSFSVDQGRICGLLGHNGAGKSTALGILLGLVYPDSGEVRINGASVQKTRSRAIQEVGAIFETPIFYEYLSGLRNIEMLASYSGGVSKSQVAEVVDSVGLSSRIYDRVATYSHGMRQRLALAQALLPQPQVLVLDEPTDGLDPEGIAEFREHLLRLRKDLGLTVLLSSHLLSEVEQTCDEVVILQKGKLVYAGAIESVRGAQQTFRIEAHDRGALVEAVVSQGGCWKGGLAVFDQPKDPAALLSELVDLDLRVSHFAEEAQSLESVYLEFGGKESRSA
ncbi:MAG: ABC transporter ATP-binding protein [Verrucomicrobiota bacterium]